MVLLKFFKRVKSEKELAKEQVENDLRDTLPDPIGPLSFTVPTLSIVAANEEVRKVYEQSALSHRSAAHQLQQTTHPDTRGILLPLN